MSLCNYSQQSLSTFADLVIILRTDQESENCTAQVYSMYTGLFGSVV